MAVTISKLAVILSAKTMQFQKDLKKAASTTKFFGMSMEKVGKIAKKAFRNITLAAAAMATAVVASLVALTKAGLASVDALSKTAARLNISTRELARFQFAGRLAGVEVRTLDMALQRMTRRISEAALGTGEAQDAIRELGLDAQKLGRMRLDEQFRAIVEAWGGVAARDKVRLAFKLFDSEGVKLVNLLNAGSKSLDIASAKADKFGLSVSQFDASQVEKANDAMTEIKAALEGLGVRLASQFAPFITALAEAVLEGNKLKEVADKIFESTLSAALVAVELANAFQLTAAFAERASLAFQTTPKQRKALARDRARLKAATPAADLLAFINKTRNALVNQRRAAAGAAANVTTAPPPVSPSIGPASEQVVNDVAEITEVVAETKTVIEDMKIAVQDISESLRVSAMTAAASIRNAQMAGALAPMQVQVGP